MIKSELTVKELAIEYVRKTFPAKKSTKGLHIRTISQYAYEQGYKDAFNNLTSLDHRYNK